jgi:hypothetical protein
MKRGKPKYATAERCAERDAWEREHYFCWLCEVQRKQWHDGNTTHEIVERSKSGQPYALHNYARLCLACHRKVQGRGHKWRCMCWALKSLFDPDNYDLRAGMEMLGRKDVDDTRVSVETMALTFAAMLETPKL